MNVMQTSDSEDEITTVLRLFREETAIPDYGEDDNFFDMGGDSLMAERIVLGVQEALGQPLQVSVLLEAPTPRMLARYVDEGFRARQANGKLVTSAPDFPNALPLAMIHGMSGSPLFVNRIGERVRSRHRLHAVRGQGLVAGEEVLTTAEETIATYSAALKAACGGMPELLGGICVGGLVAIGIARAHHAATGRRSRLVLIDPPPLGSAWLKPARDNEMSQRRARSLDRQVAFWQGLQKACEAMRIGNSAIGRKARRETFKKALTRAFAGYRPDGFPCEMLLVASSEWGKDTITGYRAWATDETRIETVTLEGRHGSFQHANRDAMDQVIAEFLDRVPATDRIKS